jgi:hypothetical protein
MLEAVCSFELLVNFYQKTQRDIPEDSVLIVVCVCILIRYTSILGAECSMSHGSLFLKPTGGWAQELTL